MNKFKFNVFVGGKACVWLCVVPRAEGVAILRFARPGKPGSAHYVNSVLSTTNWAA